MPSGGHHVLHQHFDRSTQHKKIICWITCMATCVDVEHVFLVFCYLKLQSYYNARKKRNLTSTLNSPKGRDYCTPTEQPHA